MNKRREPKEKRKVEKGTDTRSSRTYHITTLDEEIERRPKIFHKDFRTIKARGRREKGRNGHTPFRDLH